LDKDSDNTILKGYSENEEKFYKLFGVDPYLSKFISKCYGEKIDQDGKSWLCLQDVTYNYIYAQLADIKLGKYTYYQDEKGLRDKQRPDLFKKLVEQVCPNLSPEESLRGWITKERYLNHRDETTTSREFGFRFEGMRTKEICIDVKRGVVNKLEDAKKFFEVYLSAADKSTRELFIHKMKNLKTAMMSSDLKDKITLIGSSLLMVYDADDKLNPKPEIWLIDFQKTRIYDEEDPSRSTEWLQCLDNIINLLQSI